MNQEYFTIKLSSGINLALSLADMRTVDQFEIKNICPVPGVADFWYGVVNFKGSLLWVLDSDRFFDLNKENNRPSKLTAVILHNLQGRQKVALVTQQLLGILSIEASCLKPMNSVYPVLNECCRAIAQTESQKVYIIDSVALLEQLQERSTLVSV